MLSQSIIIVFVYFTLWYIIATIIKNASIVDMGWGLGFVILALLNYAQNISVHSLIIMVLVAIWGLRLFYHIFRRNFKKPEDYRYANFRKEWGKTYLIRSYFQLFILQGVLMLLISSAFISAFQTNSVSNFTLTVVGTVIWIIGFFFESVGDYQLKKFVTNPENKGKLINVGLWNYTRHPNYFGEAVMWWGIYVIALSLGVPWYTIISPITITILVRFVSGVPMLEKNLRKREGFEEYIRTTNTFIPWFKKGGKNES